MLERRVAVAAILAESQSFDQLGVHVLWEVGKERGGVLACCERRFDVSRRVGE